MQVVSSLRSYALHEHSVAFLVSSRRKQSFGRIWQGWNKLALCHALGKFIQFITTRRLALADVRILACPNTALIMSRDLHHHHRHHRRPCAFQIVFDQTNRFVSTDNVQVSFL